MFASKFFWLQKSVVLVATHCLLICILYFSPITYTDTHAANDSSSADNNASEISISSSGDNYSLLAKQAKLPDVLQELGETADFEFKLFENAIIVKSDWNFDEMPLNQLLNNLIRGYNTIMLYEDTKNVIQDNNNRKLKELWLLGKENNSTPAGPSTFNVEIQLEQEKVLPAKHQKLTAEQQFEITHIENLEGLTGDDVIETLKQTLLTEQDPVVRKRAVVALGDIGGTRVLDALETGLGDTSGDVRTELARSFASIKHQRSMLALGQLSVGDREVMVRQQAIRALARQDSPAARAFIEAALKDKDDSVKKVAREMLQ